MTSWLKILALSAAGLWALNSHAHPVSFPNNLMLMAEVDSDMRSAEANYTFKPGWAVGLSQRQWDKHGDYALTGLHLNHRVWRKNTRTSQANLYLGTGIGQWSHHAFSESAVLLEAQADWETRYWYVAAKLHGGYGRSITWTEQHLSFGRAIVARGYQDWNPWLLLDARRSLGLGDQQGWEVYPTLRFIKPKWFIEIGKPQEGVKLNIMYNQTF